MDYEWTYLWGVVNPATGEHFGLVLPEVNTQMATLFFREFSAWLGPGRHAVVVLDGAGWHGERCVLAAPNVTLLFLPPYSPQLNPIERLWRWIQERFLANRIFETIEALEERLCQAWRQITPALIKTLCRFDWTEDQNYV
jgi:transposase